MSRYAVLDAAGNAYTYRGHLLVHDDRAELEFLIPDRRVVRVSDGDLGQPVMAWRDHPDMAAVRWPIQRKDFL